MIFNKLAVYTEAANHFRYMSLTKFTATIGNLIP